MSANSGWEPDHDHRWVRTYPGTEHRRVHCVVRDCQTSIEEPAGKLCCRPRCTADTLAPGFPGQIPLGPRTCQTCPDVTP